MQCAPAHSLSLLSLTPPVHPHHLCFLALTCAWTLQTSPHRPGGARRHAGRLATLNVPELPQLPQETTAAGTALRRHHSRLPVVAFTAMGQILWPLEAS